MRVLGQTSASYSRDPHKWPMTHRSRVLLLARRRALDGDGDDGLAPEDDEAERALLLRRRRRAGVRLLLLVLSIPQKRVESAQHFLVRGEPEIEGLKAPEGRVSARHDVGKTPEPGSSLQVTTGRRRPVPNRILPLEGLLGAD